MNEDWRARYLNDRTDPVVKDLELVLRKGWRRFSGRQLRDLPSRLGLEAADVEAMRVKLLRYLLSSGAQRSGFQYFDRWDETSRFAVKLVGAHPSTRDITSVNQRREAAIREIRDSRANTAGSVAKRPWPEQPEGGIEWRLLIRMRDAIRADHPNPPHPSEPVPLPAQEPFNERDPTAAEVPASLDSFVGRERESASLRAALDEGRLVSLVGPGGAGKTRLALECLREVSTRNTAWVVRLEDVTEGADVFEAVGRQIGAFQEGRLTWLDSVVARLRDADSALLLLDNCEHVIRSASTLAGTLLASCPSLRVLATSREPLGVTGEKLIRLTGLATDPELSPPGGHSTTVPDAVQLFVERAREKDRDFAIDEIRGDRLSEIVKRIDGLPLAVELAAARVEQLSVDEIFEQVDHEVTRIASTLRQPTERHRTLEACFNWSFSLLTDAEQRALCRLSVFVGGFDRAATRAVLPGDSDHLVERLVTCSLVDRAEIRGETRFRILQPIRVSCEEKLRESGDQQSAADAHLAWYVAVAEEAADAIGGEPASTWLPRLDDELANFREAIQHAIRTENLEALLRFAGLWWYWFLRGLWAEARAPLEMALEATGEGHPRRARAALAAGTVAWASGDLRAASEWLKVARDSAEEADDKWCVSQVAHIEGHISHQQGDWDRAEARFTEALRFWINRPDSYWKALLLDDVGSLAADCGDFDGASAALEQALRTAKAVHDRQAEGNSLAHLTAVARRQAKLDAAEVYGEAAVRVLRDLGYRRGLATALRNLADVQRERGRAGNAHALLDEATRIQRAVGHRNGLARSALSGALLAAAERDFPRAAELLAEARVLRERGGAAIPPMDAIDEQRLYEQLCIEMNRAEIASAEEAARKRVPAP